MDVVEIAAPAPEGASVEAFMLETQLAGQLEAFMVRRNNTNKDSGEL